MLTPFRSAATAALAFVGVLSAQVPPGAPMPRDVALETTLPATGPAQQRMQAGLTALTNGNFEEARKHLFAALEFHPSSPDLLLELVCASSNNLDAMSQWTERYVRAATNEKGRFKMGGPTRKRLQPIKPAAQRIKNAQALSAKRVAAITELSRFIIKQKVKGKQTAARALLVRWASEVLLKVAKGCPQALAKVSLAIDNHQASFAPDYDIIYRALTKIMNQPVPEEGEDSDAPTTGQSSDARVINDQRIRAARILVGLARQVAFKDLKGPRPAGPGSHAADARKILADERKRDVEAGKIWTIAELEDMSEEDIVRFTEEHSDWHHVGLALSTNGFYRIETTCGHETLLQTAKTIELHHVRLISHFGKDPFIDRQGIARIVPENSDMETEGAPFWWAGGFQGGDRTTVRFAWSNIASLGKTLTHELTHRFDGVLRPFMPSWYGEGHADWTSGHYGQMKEKTFTKNYLRIGTAARTYYLGYERKKKFLQLLKGEIEDYRDNYPAGYSLYAFLTSYPPTKPRYRDVMAKFERNARAGQRDPVGYFTSTFCDGKDGRPVDFDELHEDWGTFLRGCYDWQDNKRENNQWIRDYGRPPKAGGSRPVLDVPTRSWARNHAEPFYGQEHAAAATLLFDETADINAAIAAGVWSLTADGWRPEVARALAKALAASREQDAAVTFAAMAHNHFPEVAAVDGSKVLEQLPKTQALLTAMATRIDALLTENATNAAAATARDHASITNSFGIAPTKHAKPDAIARLPRHLGSNGFTESELTGFEDRRRKGLWYVTSEGDLHVGRNKPREGTGVIDRRAHQRHAYAHSVTWLTPGHYVIRGRVHWTTSYVSGAIVLGHTRRDRSIRIGFSAGDFNYARGKSESNDREGRVSLNLRGLWERDGKLPRTQFNTSVEIPEKQNWFAYELHVRGPRVEIVINDEALWEYAVHDGTPIEGHLGFATSTGAIRVQQPTVQRLDNEVTSPVLGLDLQRQPTRSLKQLMQLQTRGIPTHPDGTLVLWLPTVDEGSPSNRLGRAIRQLSKIMQDKLQHPQQWVLAVPINMGMLDRKTTVADLQDLRPGPFPILEHQIGDPFDGPYPWVLFLDAQGVLRAAANSRDTGIHTKVAKWSQIYRGR
jgi:hypothetical protein